MITYCLGCEKPIHQKPEGRKRLFHTELCRYRWRGRTAPKAGRAKTVCTRCGQTFRQEAGRGQPRKRCTNCRK